MKALGFEAPRQLSRGRHPSLPYAQMPDFMADLRSREAIAARALEFLILTGVRTDAVLKARWEQFDLDQAIWTVPLTSLKDRAHRSEGFRVPLSNRAVEIIRDRRRARACEVRVRWQCAGQAALEHGDADPPAADELGQGPTTGSIPARRQAHHGAWLSRLLQDLGRRGRHSSRTRSSRWRSVIQVGNAVERAYRRTDLVDQRRGLMEAWTRHCELREAGKATVVSLRRTA